MALNDRKITDDDIAYYGVQSQPNKLTGSAQQNKQAFDKLIDEVVQEKFNALIDELLAATAAGQIGVATSASLQQDNVQAALEYIIDTMVSMSQGDVPDGSIDADKLADDAVTEAKIDDGAVTADKLGGILPEHVGIKYGPEMPTTATLGEGEIYLKLESE